MTVNAVFVFIGATPCTDWLDGQLAMDPDGFLLTGQAVALPAGHRMRDRPATLAYRTPIAQPHGVAGGQ